MFDDKWHWTMNSTKEQELLDALTAAERSGDAGSIEDALGGLSLYYVVHERFAEAAPYWRRQALLVEQTTAPDSREFGTFLHNMAATCLIPAGFVEEARATLLRAQEIYSLHFRPEDVGIRQVEQLLHELPI
jgi:hypothetical protein